MPAERTPTLSQELERLDAAVEALREEITQLLTNAPITTEYTPDSFAADRYVLAMPDGSRYWNVPLSPQYYSGFVQRPAALRAARNLPGCRVYDSKTKTYVTE